jgi:hypoxanthine phosphoribosyltransferase
MGAARENLDYETFGRAVRELAQVIADDGYEPDIVLCVARGGVFVAGGLAYALDSKNTWSTSSSIPGWGRPWRCRSCWLWCRT